MRFSQWRPIGVCDSAPDGERKARMFARDDLEKVLAPGLGRNNWENSLELRKIIERYAKDVAKLSPKAKVFERPKVAEIRLVGMELHFAPTPGLNKESIEGQVQLFEVSFEEGVPPPQIKWPVGWIAMIGALLLILSGMLITIPLLQEDDSRSTAVQDVLCGTGRASMTYQSHLQQMLRELELYARSTPTGRNMSYSRSACEDPSGNVPKDEVSLLRCVLQLQRTDSAFLQTRTSERAQFCVSQVCANRLPEHQAFCRQF
jgi:hypothetical protein